MTSIMTQVARRKFKHKLLSSINPWFEFPTQLQILIGVSSAQYGTFPFTKNVLVIRRHDRENVSGIHVRSCQLALISK